MSTNWDGMREWERRMQELKEDAAEEGIEVSDESISAAMGLLYELQGPGNAPYKDGNRLFALGDDNSADSASEEEGPEDDEWRIPPLVSN